MPLDPGDQSPNDAGKPPKSITQNHESSESISYSGETAIFKVPQTIEFEPGQLIGRYEYVCTLGKGGFGQVVQAKDHRLNRTVAIKFPRLDKFDEHAVTFLEEARSVARLDHRSIIQVHNVEQTDDGWPFVVMEFVGGPTLAEVVRGEGLTYAQAVRYLIQITDALAYAHDQTLIHRDIKPANVIISNKDDTAKLADFGMALHDLTPEETLADCPQGTPPFMAPEQIRGENHRLDRRTDIWGLGVLMYIVLTNKRPFNADSLPDLVRKICREDPVPLGEINGEVPRELERICLKCLEKLMKDRYQNASLIAEDLRAFETDWQEIDGESLSSSKIKLPQESPSDSNQTTNKSTRSSQRWDRRETENAASETLNSFRIVPKGLRSFDTQDAEFFAELLPGPKDRWGIPDSVQFWVNQLQPESTSPLSVGLIYGPSGCGKSSFVKAALIPNLDDSIRTIYLEASPQSTEADLLAKLKIAAPNVVRDETRLATVLSRIRRGQLMTGEKLLVVIDQFEQWLSVQEDHNEKPLIEALRHCDGVNLSCLLLIRDDFWMSASQFMNHLDMRVQEGVNALAIPLFDRKHARKVLSGYGRALHSLPDYGVPLSSSQKKFIELAVEQMSENGHVVPIHLSMFAQMLDSDSWHLNELKKQGGWQGIGTRFLGKIFSDKRLSNSEDVCRSVLSKLLPNSDSPIKGAEKPLSHLLPNDASTSGQKSLHRVLDLLDREFRIITPTESDASEPHYQLAHDSLVTPIRSWLAQKATESWQGRAQLRIEQLAAQWSERNETRFMPSLFEFLPMLGVNRAGLKSNESRYMNKASRFYAARGLLVAFVIALIAWSGHYFWQQSTFNRASEHYSDLLRAPAGEVQLRLQILEQYSPAHRQRLMDGEAGTDWKQRKDLYALYAKAHFANRADQFPVQDLIDSISEAVSNEAGNVIPILQGHGLGGEVDQAIQKGLREAFENSESDEHRVRMAIVALHVGNLELAKDVVRHRPDPELRETFIETFPSWHGPISDAIQVVRNSPNDDLVSALCKSMGLIERAEFGQTNERKLIEVFRSRYVQSRSGNVHSAAEWVLRKWEQPLPKPSIREFGSPWFMESVEEDEALTFIRIDPHKVFYGPVESQQGGSAPPTREMKHGFYVSSKEVPARLFWEYMKSFREFRAVPMWSGFSAATVVWIQEPTYEYFTKDPIYALSDQDLPIYDVTWNEAILFCNWLSRRQGRQPKYEFDQENIRWVPNPQANGFRLPTDFEFEVFNRAGTSTKYFFGDTIRRLQRYACGGSAQPTFEKQNVLVDLRGRRMPNDFGIFDSVGNAYEWCEDINPEFEWAGDSTFSLRGGSSSAASVYFESSRTAIGDIQLRYDSGIRLVMDINDIATREKE